MEILSILLTIAGLCLFEAITSIDNAIINAGVLSTMSQRARRWFLVWGLLFAVFVIRGILPWLIVWISAPSLGPVGALTATFSSDPARHSSRRSGGTRPSGRGWHLPYLPLLPLALFRGERVWDPGRNAISPRRASGSLPLSRSSLRPSSGLRSGETL